MRSQFGRSQTYEDAQLGIQLHIRTVWVLLSLSFMAAGRQVVYDRQEFIEFLPPARVPWGVLRNPESTGFRGTRKGGIRNPLDSAGPEKSGIRNPVDSKQNSRETVM